MHVAVISDVHANLHALESVLAAIDAERPDELWCLGDLVGYGPRPNECVAIVRERADVCLAGNHDLVALGQGGVGLEEFNPDAGAAAAWTRATLSDDSRAFLESLRPEARRAGAELFHASPRDPVWEYVLSGETAGAALDATEEQVVLVGHTHIAMAIWRRADVLDGGIARGGTKHEFGHARWLLNPGSVGQPRDGDPRAAWLSLDLDGGSAEFKRVEYPVALTQSEIREEGLPDALALRLANGL
jgi:predicted phosphodiesterase